MESKVNVSGIDFPMQECKVWNIAVSVNDLAILFDRDIIGRDEARKILGFDDEKKDAVKEFSECTPANEDLRVLESLSQRLSIAGKKSDMLAVNSGIVALKQMGKKLTSDFELFEFDRFALIEELESITGEGPWNLPIQLNDGKLVKMKIKQGIPRVLPKPKIDRQAMIDELNRLASLCVSTDEVYPSLKSIFQNTRFHIENYPELYP